jgi:hypothetical protein
VVEPLWERAAAAAAAAVGDAAAAAADVKNAIPARWVVRSGRIDHADDNGDDEDNRKAREGNGNGNGNDGTIETPDSSLIPRRNSPLPPGVVVAAAAEGGGGLRTRLPAVAVVAAADAAAVLVADGRCGRCCGGGSSSTPAAELSTDDETRPRPKGECRACGSGSVRNVPAGGSRGCTGTRDDADNDNGSGNDDDRNAERFMADPCLPPAFGASDLQ